ncbi:MAG: hypothetical protein ACM3ST_09565 [Bdellovibrio bacteriovorus]
MRFLIKSLGWLLSLALLSATILAALIYLDSRPRVPEARTLTGAERAWAEGWLRAARPQGPREGDPVTLTLTEAEANLLLDYLIDRLGEGRAQIRLAEGRAQIAASLGLPWDAEGRFLNLDLELSGSGRPPRIERLRLAGLTLPETLARTLAEQALDTLDRGQVLQSLVIEPGQIRVTYAWHPEGVATLGQGLLSPAGWERILEYQELIWSQTATAPKGGQIQLAGLLSRLLAEAGDRSRAGDPVAENRAAILALAAYVNRRTLPDPSQVRGPGAEPSPQAPAFHPVRLRGRADLAQHFMTSAAIATQGGDALSELLGLYKEIADARGGSGFSFADLAADRAGNRFALSAAGDPEGARMVQELARQGLAEGDFMPATDGLPEGLDRDALTAGLADHQNPAYRRLANQIERTIDALPMHRGSGR